MTNLPYILFSKLLIMSIRRKQLIRLKFIHFYRYTSNRFLLAEYQDTV